MIFEKFEHIFMMSKCVAIFFSQSCRQVSCCFVLDSLVDPLQKTINYKPKLDAVKQEVDRNENMIRSALRAISSLSHIRFCTSYHIYYPYISISKLNIPFVLDGKIYIRCDVSSMMPSNVHVIVCKPSSGTWEHADKDLVSGWSGPAIVVEGNLYVLDQSCVTRLMMWENKSR
ncbi:hypothetical protein MKX01_018128 [Papaver californicum]|nr:hypothetical protein MKX01_018128 [Papaver californicum]